MSRFTSRKFLLAVASVVLVTLNEVFDLGIDEQAYMAIVGPIVAFIAAEGAIDFQRARNGKVR